MNKVVVKPVYDDRNNKIGWVLYVKGMEVDSAPFLRTLLEKNNLCKSEVEIVE